MGEKAQSGKNMLKITVEIQKDVCPLTNHYTGNCHFCAIVLDSEECQVMLFLWASHQSVPVQLSARVAPVGAHSLWLWSWHVASTVMKGLKEEFYLIKKLASLGRRLNDIDAVLLIVCLSVQEIPSALSGPSSSMWSTFTPWLTLFGSVPNETSARQTMCGTTTPPWETALSTGSCSEYPSWQACVRAIPTTPFGQLISRSLRPCVLSPCRPALSPCCHLPVAQQIVPEEAAPAAVSSSHRTAGRSPSLVPEMSHRRWHQNRKMLMMGMLLIPKVCSFHRRCPLF